MRRKISKEEKKKPYAFALHQPVAERVKNEAWKKRISVSLYVEQALISYMEKENKNE